MKKLNLLLTGLLVAGGMMFTSCTKEDNPAVPPSDPTPTVDERINQVIPDDLREKVEEYITIYDGVNPPNVEGVYRLDPEVLVKSTLSGDYAGKVFTSQYHRYYNQDMKKNTIDMLYVTDGENEWMKGSGAFICGYDDKFTIYFNSYGQNGSVTFKMAIVVSGSKTDAGIADLSWAFVMVEKGEDPYGDVVPVGTIRSFKDSDGLSDNAEWPYGNKYDALARTRAAITNSISSFVKTK